MIVKLAAAVAVLALASTPVWAQPAARGPTNILTAADVFNLEHAANPRISPDGSLVAYERVSGDIMTDRFRRSIWLVDANGRTHRPMAQGAGNYTQPVWSPNGRAVAYAANEAGRSELRVFYLDTQRSATLTRLAGGPANLTWSPDGQSLAFQMFTETDDSHGPRMPERPDGAEWAAPARVIERMQIRADGQGFLPNGAI